MEKDGARAGVYGEPRLSSRSLSCDFVLTFYRYNGGDDPRTKEGSHRGGKKEGGIVKSPQC